MGDTPPETVLEVAGLTKRYGRFLAVDDVSLHVAAGSVTGLLGPNGSGKSSILHSVTGVIEPTAGSITIAGHGHQSPEAKRELGFVPDDLALPTSLTGAEFLDLGRRLQREFSTELMADLLDLLDLTSATRKLVAEYSHGMKRKLQVVSALCHGPALLILDEPFRGLDPEAAVVLRALVEAFVAHAGGVLVATHDLLTAQTFCDQVWIIAGGRLVAGGSPAALMAEFGRSTLEDVFLTATGIESRAQGARARIREISLLGRRHEPVAGVRS
ncbi:ABC transporter ATP-binding protein [Dactylosporangium sp. CA-233914]|uniref:ABC transporter ATP-binding protein n=1 Tax=Dactylosporangium sp. CA-233914 TaxID=3239934 RepID=UPI003D8DB43A